VWIIRCVHTYICVEHICIHISLSHRFSRRVSRVFSLNTTPRGAMKRFSSIAHIASPMKREMSSVCRTSALMQHLPSTPDNVAAVMSTIINSSDDVSVCTYLQCTCLVLCIHHPSIFVCTSTCVVLYISSFIESRLFRLSIG